MFILNSHFPRTLHQDILLAVGITEALDIAPTAMDRFTLSRYREGQAAFRARALDTYRRRCAVCGYSVRVQDVQVGIEAAHIRWHAASGPYETPNGLSLRALHHKLFDYGGVHGAPRSDGVRE